MEKLTTIPAGESSGEKHSQEIGVMKKGTASPDQYYLSIAFLGALIVFRSSSQQIAVRSILSLAALLILWQFLLFLRAVIAPIPLIVFTSFIAVVIGTITSELFLQIPFLGITTGTTMMPEQLYLLLCVPVLVFQAEHRIAEVRHRTLRAYLVFSGLIILIATIREFLGDGALFGRRILPEMFPVMTMFRHVSSAAFLLAAIMVFAQWIIQRTGKGNLSFVNQAKDNTSDEIPYLQIAREKSYLQVSFLFLLATILSGMFPMALLILFGNVGIPLIYLLPATVLAQGIVIGLIYLLSGTLRSTFADLCLRSMIIPMQTMVLILPFYLTKIEMITPERAFWCLALFSVYLIAGWFFAGSTMLFIRVVKRKLIFGKRPNFVDGLPLSFIMLGISLIILSGFASILDHGMYLMFMP